jgi:hypothetical protein
LDYLNYIIKFERHPIDGIALGAFYAKVKIRVNENRNLGLRRWSSCRLQAFFMDVPNHTCIDKNNITPCLMMYSTANLKLLDPPLKKATSPAFMCKHALNHNFWTLELQYTND